MKTFRTILSLLLLFATPFAFACMCAPSREAARAKNMRELVAIENKGVGIIFEGEVEKQEVKAGPAGEPSGLMSITPAGSHRVVTVRVMRAYRGLSGTTAIVLTGMGTGDCGYDFETSHKYLVYAEKIPTGQLFTSICTPTAPVEESGPALRLLRGEPAAPEDLLDIESYYQRRFSQTTGELCGRVTKPDGSGLGYAGVELAQLRDDPKLPAARFADENTSKPDGSFCIRGIRPGKYVLTAESIDHNISARWMGFYPGVTNAAAAKAIEIAAGTRIADFHFAVQQQPLYTIGFRIVTSDGTPAPIDHLGVAIGSDQHDALTYHENQNRNENGVYMLGYIPPGHYTVITYPIPDDSDAIPESVRKWQMAKREVDIAGNGVVVLTLTKRN